MISPKRRIISGSPPAVMPTWPSPLVMCEKYCVPLTWPPSFALWRGSDEKTMGMPRREASAISCMPLDQFANFSGGATPLFRMQRKFFSSM